MAKVSSSKTKRGKLGYRICRRENEDTGMVGCYARLVPFSKLDAATVNQWASEFMNVSEAQMKAAFAALSDAIQYFVLNGHSVSMGDLGCFYFSTKTGLWDEKARKWKSAGKTAMDDVQASDIRATYVRFRLSTELRQRLGGSQLFDVESRVFGEQLVRQTYVKG